MGLAGVQEWGMPGSNKLFISWWVNAAIGMSHMSRYFSDAAAIAEMSHLDLLTDMEKVEASPRDLEWLARHRAMINSQRIIYGFRTRLMTPELTQYYTEKQKTEALREMLIDMHVQGIE